MAGPHPTVAAARRALRTLLKEAGVAPGSRLLLACSGGSDSMALAQATLFVGSRDGYVVDALTVDHGLREESAREAEHVRAQLLGLGVRHADVARVTLDSGGGPEAEARSARYAAIARVAESTTTARARAAGNAGLRDASVSPDSADFPEATATRGATGDDASDAADSGEANQTTTQGTSEASGRSAWARAAVVLLGHTADDQAETVLLGLARGSGARSIRGMAAIARLPEHPQIMALRPLLDLRREDLRAGLRSAGISWVEDPTNEPTSHWRAQDGSPLRRSALRHHAIPALEQDLGPGVVEALARTARLLQADEEALELWTRRECARIVDEESLSVSILELRQLPRAVRTRVLKVLALQAGARAGELVGWHVDHLDELVTGPGGGRGIDLPGVRGEQRAGRIHFGR
ncbi:MAG: tRNA lysidine(34) synthetase [Ancrocorticia sp.]